MLKGALYIQTRGQDQTLFHEENGEIILSICSDLVQ